LPRELLSAEVRILYALHQQGACRGEAVSIARESDGLRVRATVNSPETKARILSALSGMPEWVRPEIRTIGEAARQKRAEALPAEVAAPSAPMVAVARLPVQDELEAYFKGRPAEMTAFSNQAVVLAEEALTEAWALRRLSDRFGDWNLDPESAARVERMTAEHAAALLRINQEARRVIAPVVDALAARREIKALDADGASLFDDVQRMHSCVMTLFAVDLAAAPASREAVNHNIAGLLGSFQRIDAAVEARKR
jgi:hypothetical protein